MVRKWRKKLTNYETRYEVSSVPKSFQGIRTICKNIYMRKKKNYMREENFTNITLSKIGSVSVCFSFLGGTRSSSSQRRHQDHIDRTKCPISWIVLVELQWPNRDSLPQTRWCIRARLPDDILIYLTPRWTASFQKGVEIIRNFEFRESYIAQMRLVVSTRYQSAQLYGIKTESDKRR